MTEEIAQEVRLTPEQARWRCRGNELGFSSTADLSPEHQILGQEEAVEALQFGLESRSHGNNVFVRGLSGFGRMSLIHQLIEQGIPDGKVAPDRLYVFNFQFPDQPALMSLPAGTGAAFRIEMDKFADFAEKELPVYLSSDRIKAKQKDIASRTQQEIQKIGTPFEAELKEQGLVMVPMQIGQNMVPVILPLINDKPAQFEEVQALRTEGKLLQEDYDQLVQKIGEYEQKFGEIAQDIAAVQTSNNQSIQKLVKDEANLYVGSQIQSIKKRFSEPRVHEFLDQVVEDLIDKQMFDQAGINARRYRVNLVRSRNPSEGNPVISQRNPTLTNLVGKIDREFGETAMSVRSDHLMVKPGDLLEADGGYLILDAQDILSEPGAWAVLLRTLKTGMFEVTNADPFGMWATPQIRPEMIDVDLKVVLVGDPDVYYLLDAHEPRFARLFKVLADFSETIARDADGKRAYGNVVARVVEADELLHFSADAVAELIEHGARICAQKGRLTSRFGRVADVAREAAFLAKKAGKSLSGNDDVIESVRRSKRRAEIPALRFRRMVAERTLLIDVKGRAVGQVNGLAVTSAGPLTYGFPTRITASIGPGTAGAVNIERESDLSGSVHTKGFLILSGLLRQALDLKHPMAFSASIAFEQTYGGIDGDSASGAEFCCLISALTNMPIRQDLAMTGAVDQKGNVLPIGAATEKIEGFFDACQALEYTGTQGVIIPAANAGELMVRHDVVAAVEAGTFNIFAVSRIDQALALLLDHSPGEFGSRSYTEGSILSLAQQRAHEFWETASAAHKSD
ncbi:MAG: ATP-binding protein [Proteobacteria bacterium]|nr:ATP-binding protein [Pseudomonadota bacterium]